MVAMHKHNALANLRELPLFSMDQTWTIKCATALVHWCSWQLERIEATGNPAMKLEVCAVQSKAKRWAKRCQPAKKARGRLRKREQGDKIAKLADCETLKAAARQACYSFVASLTVRTVGGMVVSLYTTVPWGCLRPPLHSVLWTRFRGVWSAFEVRLKCVWSVRDHGGWPRGVRRSTRRVH